MKIKGMEWMNWLHKSRRESQALRKSKRQSLVEYLRGVEEKRGVSGKRILKASGTKGK
ncbi:MAG: hypothetical protein ACE5KO_05475 [Candidatus Bathyarchaeia archaeon]